jgi:hypothetical protein
VNDWTSTPQWWGDRLDLDYAVGCVASVDSRLAPERAPPD